MLRPQRSHLTAYFLALATLLGAIPSLSTFAHAAEVQGFRSLPVEKMPADFVDLRPLIEIGQRLFCDPVYKDIEVQPSSSLDVVNNDTRYELLYVGNLANSDVYDVYRSLARIQIVRPSGQPPFVRVIQGLYGSQRFVTSYYDKCAHQRSTFASDRVEGREAQLVTARHYARHDQRVRVAVVDIDFDHGRKEVQDYLLLDDAGKVVTASFDGHPICWGTKDGHGTAVASLIAKGPNVAIIPIERSDRELMGLSYKVKNFDSPLEDLQLKHRQEIEYQLIRYAVRNGARIVNMSFNILADQARNPDMFSGFGRAMQEFKDVIFVVSAGNHGVDTDTRQSYPSAYHYPNVVVVTSVDQHGRLFRHNYGQTSVDLAATGVDLKVWGTGADGLKKASGTSLAAPLVARGLAAILTHYPHYTPEQAIEALRPFVTKMPSLESKTRMGGFLRIERLEYEMSRLSVKN